MEHYLIFQTMSVHIMTFSEAKGPGSGLFAATEGLYLVKNDLLRAPRKALRSIDGSVMPTR